MDGGLDVERGDASLRECVNYTREENQPLIAQRLVVLSAGDATASCGFRVKTVQYSLPRTDQTLWLTLEESQVLPGLALGSCLSQDWVKHSFFLSHAIGSGAAGPGQSPHRGVTPPGSKERGEWGLQSSVRGRCLPAVSWCYPVPGLWSIRGDQDPGLQREPGRQVDPQTSK